LELRVNGVFVMDDDGAASEQALATVGMAAVVSPRRVLVGGLGLGFTLRAVLEDPRVEQVTVVELEPVLVHWLRCGLAPGGAAALEDPRVSVLVADVADAVTAAATGAYDLALLDVDNGPDFLVHDANADLYRVPFLQACRRMLDGRGALVVWSMSESRALADRLRAVFGQVRTRPCPVRLGARDESYWLHVATPAASPDSGH
jgi:spermidine synthase